MQRRLCLPANTFSGRCERRKPFRLDSFSLSLCIRQAASRYCSNKFGITLDLRCLSFGVAKERGMISSRPLSRSVNRPLPKFDLSGYDGEQRMSLGNFLPPEPFHRRDIPYGQFSAQMLPFVEELPFCDLYPGYFQVTRYRGSVEAVSPLYCLVQYPAEIGFYRSQRIGCTAKAFELGMLFIARCFTPEHAAGQKPLPPASGKAFGVEITRMERP